MLTVNKTKAREEAVKAAKRIDAKNDPRHRKDVEEIVLTGLIASGVIGGKEPSGKAQRVLESIKSGKIPGLLIDY